MLFIVYLLFILQSTFNLGGVYCGSSSTTPFKLINKANTRARIEFDLSRYADFELEFPGKQTSGTVQEIHTSSIKLMPLFNTTYIVLSIVDFRGLQFPADEPWDIDHISRLGGGGRRQSDIQTVRGEEFIYSLIQDTYFIILLLYFDISQFYVYGCCFLGGVLRFHHSCDYKPDGSSHAQSHPDSSNPSPLQQKLPPAHHQPPPHPCLHSNATQESRCYSAETTATTFPQCTGVHAYSGRA